MSKEIQKLHDVWIETQIKSVNSTVLPKMAFDNLTNSIISTGLFYFYVIDFCDMSIFHLSPSVYEVHGFNPESTIFDDILKAIHPDDIDFVVKAEAFFIDFFNKKLGREKMLNYKVSYCFRVILANGTYALLNHQSLLLTLDDDGRFGKSLNIHTLIDHISKLNTYKISLIGLNGEPSFMNLSLGGDNKSVVVFSKREVDIIKNIADGLSSIEIAKKLFISDLTVKKHRKNILKKSACKNTAQLVKDCILQGLI